MADPPQLEARTVVLLRWPERLPDLTEDELRRGRLTYDVWTWLVPVGELRI